ncbi:long-chain fatty acid--CoA ligase [Rhodopseudomonas boonkerdii]|uniref:class I adenylate-forming enzyme family protein n=1 Tax=Rhodopseudomonas boonkerdii TaxID=475937 RepID=UPI001E47D9E6|nr:class I adenylate-forming enzyme family protein [Rhodopseudomonas boonkerdii]UGV28669.1 long-chain fatty acid--CoA ligase [Rhodopseudomonas boonkerdii]
MPAELDGITMAGSCQTVSELFRSRAKVQSNQVAIEYQGREISYGELLDRIERLTSVLSASGLRRGDRVALLSRNRPEYIEVELAAANLGVITACLNWRLSSRELSYCVDLVSPKLVIVETDLKSILENGDRKILEIGPAYEDQLAQQINHECQIVAQAEDGLVILYTSGTTGVPKGAIISHRAMIARSLVFSSELAISNRDSFVAWAPMFHMASTDHAISTLLRGGIVVMIDGFQIKPMLNALAHHQIGWLVLIPGMVEAFAAALKQEGTLVKGVRVCGAMADLVPPHAIAEVTELLQAPYLNSFGATETGLPPATRALIAPGIIPQQLPKQQNAFCQVKLVDPLDREVTQGMPGELVMRGPTLFSGYWQADDVNQRDFRNGWFHMGDVFRRNEDGTLEFVDRVKYLIKSGGENVYPAEIERVLMSDSRVAEAAVVRAADNRWGEVPVAFVARSDDSVTEADLVRLCRRELAAYKCPQQFKFINFSEFPRSTSGKVQRHELEAMLTKAAAGGNAF